MEVGVRAESVSPLCPTSMTSRVFTTKETRDSYKFGISYPISVFRCIDTYTRERKRSIHGGRRARCVWTAQARSDYGWPCCTCCQSEAENNIPQEAQPSNLKAGQFSSQVTCAWKRQQFFFPKIPCCKHGFVVLISSTVNQLIVTLSQDSEQSNCGPTDPFFDEQDQQEANEHGIYLFYHTSHDRDGRPMENQNRLVQFSCHSVMSDSLRPQGLQHTRLPCPSPTPGAYSTHVH